MAKRGRPKKKVEIEESEIQNEAQSTENIDDNIDSQNESLDATPTKSVMYF